MTSTNILSYRVVNMSNHLCLVLIFKFHNIAQEEVPKDSATISSGDVDFSCATICSPIHSPVYEDEALRLTKINMFGIFCCTKMNGFLSTNFFSFIRVNV